MSVKHFIPRNSCCSKTSFPNGVWGRLAFFCNDSASNAYYSLGAWDSGSVVKMFASDIIANLGTDQNINTGVLTGGTDTLGTALLVSAGETVTFRIMMDAGTQNNNTAVAIKNIRLSGTVTPIPEPSTYAIAGGLGAVAVALIARRRKQK